MNPHKLSITFGSDPEFCLYDHATSRIVSSLSVIKNNKHDPIILDKDTKMYSDNVLTEVSFRPSYTVAGAVVAMRDVLEKCHRNLGKRYALLPIASHNFDDLPERPSDEQVMKWLNDPEDKGKSVPEEWRIGCNPNYDAYMGDFGGIRPQAPFTDNLRTGSFHIHVGNMNYRDTDESTLLTAGDKIKAVKLMDIFVGLASVIFDKDPSSKERKKLYGRAGEFRPTPYGIEYRVLGNYALRSPTLTQLVYELTDFAMGMFNDDTANVDKAQECINMTNMNKVQEAINNSDRELAITLLRDSWLTSTLWQRAIRGKDVNAYSTLKEWGI